MASRSLRAVATVFVLFAAPFALAACGSEAGNPKDSLKSAGGLPESRLPHGMVGDSPAPTRALPRDKSLEAGWYKRARQGQKAPTAGDRASMLFRTVPRRASVIPSRLAAGERAASDA